MNRDSILQLILAAVAGLVVAGMVYMAWPGSANSSTAAVTHAEPSNRPAMQDFELPDLEGRKVRFSEFTSGRPFVITFGQTTCPPCVQQSLVFKELEKKYGEDVAFLKVYIGQSPQVAARQVQQLESPTKTLIDLDAKIYYRYGKGPIPVTLVGDAEGRIISVGTFFPPQALIPLLDKELEEAEPIPSLES